jgi:hypothetical protein
MAPSGYSSTPGTSNHSNSVILLTTSTVVDSEGHHGAPITIDPAVMDQMGFRPRITQLQLLQCSKSLVTQLGTINSQFNTLNSSSLCPPTFKTFSKWKKSTEMTFSARDATLLGSDLV